MKKIIRSIPALLGMIALTFAFLSVCNSVEQNYNAHPGPDAATASNVSAQDQALSIPNLDFGSTVIINHS